MAEKGICIRCGEKFGTGLSIGFCGPSCADKSYAEERAENIKQYPYAVIDIYGREHEVFKTKSSAEDYLWEIDSSMEIIERK